MLLDRFLFHLRQSLHQDPHGRQGLLKSSIVVIDESMTTNSCELHSWLKIIMGFLEAKVVITNVLQLFLVFLISIVEELVHTFVLRLSLYKFEEGLESLFVLISFNMEVNTLKSLVNIFFFENRGPRFVCKSNHVPV